MEILTPSELKSSRKSPQPRASDLADSPSAVCLLDPPASPVGSPLPSVSPSIQYPASYGSYLISGWGDVVNDGLGDRPEYKCGGWKAAKCPTPGHKADRWTMSCDSYRCPVCHLQAAYNDARDGAERLQVGRSLSKFTHGAYHWELSPPESLYHLEPVELRRWAMKIIKAQSEGDYGFSMTLHGFRFNADGNRLYREYCAGPWTGDDADPADQAWAWLKSRPDRDALVKWSPHFHIVGYLWLKNSDAFHRETGWVYKKISEKYLNPVSLRCVLNYVYNHKTLVRGMETTTWVGFVAKNRLGYAEERVQVDVICETCGKPQHLLPGHWLDVDGKVVDTYPDGKPKYNHLVVPWAGPGEDDRPEGLRGFSSQAEFIESLPVRHRFRVERLWVYCPEGHGVKELIAYSQEFLRGDRLSEVWYG